MNAKRYSLRLTTILTCLLMVASLLVAPSQVPPTLAQGPQEPRPKELQLVKAHAFTGDLRDLPQTKLVRTELAKRPDPPLSPTLYGTSVAAPQQSVPGIPQAPAPAPLMNFAGLDFAGWGAGHPPDPNGDVGPTYYIQTINTSIGIFSKTTGSRVTAFRFDTFMSQGNFGNLCDTDNFGDPVVLYDTFEDRWIITDFAFQLDVSGNVINPPGAFQCFAVSRTGDPVTGGWNFYSINPTGGLNDYPKFGIWPDGLYMSTNMFDYAATGSFQDVRVFAFNKAQMYAGTPTVQVVSFDAPPGEFTLLPANARLQVGTPPAGTPNYFVSTSQFLNAVGIYKFHVDWNRVSLSTFTGPFTSLASSSRPNASVPFAPSLGGNSLDTLGIRAMMQNQYSNIGGVESLWATHTVRRGDISGFAAPRWYQVNVTGGTIAANLPQAATWDPDGANVIYRFMPSLAVDRMGDLALGYSTSSSTTKPAIKYAGRLATDPINTFSQGEQLLFQGAGTQVGSCGGTCTRWGDYSAMTLDPDGCTFWYTNQYYDVDGLNYQTRIGSFKYAECTPVGSGGTVQGTVTRASDSTPLSGATVQLGTRITTTNGSGVYQFTTVPSGTYPSLTVSLPGYTTGSASPIIVTDGLTTTQNFSLTAAATSNCLIDTTQADFQLGVATNCDLTGAPGDVTLLNAPAIDQQNTTVTNNGFGFTSSSWAGQTFRAGVSDQLTRVDLDLFCSGCTGTTPNITVAIRATTGSPSVPTGADLATATIPGFSSDSGGYFTADFSSNPVTLTAGITYAVIMRAVSNPSAGTYAYVCSCSSPDSNPYANGQRVTSANSGSTWTADTTSGGRDLGFKVYMRTGFTSSGNLVSGLKDANPIAGSTPTWKTLSWTASTNINTSIKFQAAASNNPNGPFTFVGPSGTAATYFTTTSASLAQFNGLRYLKYTAYLSTTNSTLTPVLNDVTVCFQDVQTHTLSTAIAGSGGGTISLNPPGGVYDFGTVVTLTATPNLSSTFTGWSGDLNSIVNPISITMDADKFITATFTFVKATATITLSNLTQAYDGAPKPVTATTNPLGLSVVITYTGTGGTVYGPSTIAPTNAGTYQVDATIDDANYQGSASGALTINKASTTTSVTSAPNPSVFGQTVTFTATVSSTPTASGGTVAFFDNGNLIGTNALASGAATFSTSALNVGTHPITATYSGGTNFSGSASGAIAHTVNKANTTTNITSSTNPSFFGQAVTFTATVAISGAGAGTPTGVLTLTIDSTLITQTLSASGVVTYSTSTLAVGVHPVTAAYSGDTNFNGSSQTLVGGQVVTDTAISGLTAANSSPTSLTDTTFFTAAISAGTNVSYQWNFGDGQIGSGVTTTHTYASAGTYTAVVTATNSVSTRTATTIVHIVASPVAQADSDQTTRTGKLVTLDGSASFDPGNFLPLTYQWQQTGGPLVTLVGMNNVTATFTAPAITQTQVLTFTLLVTNTQSIASLPDTVVITVEPYRVMLPLVLR